MSDFAQIFVGMSKGIFSDSISVVLFYFISLAIVHTFRLYADAAHYLISAMHVVTSTIVRTDKDECEIQINFKF